MFPSRQARSFVHGVCREGENGGHSDSQDRVHGPDQAACQYFQQGYCVNGDCCRYEHDRPLREEAAAATDLPAKPSLAAVCSLSCVAGALPERNGGEHESTSASLRPTGAGCKDRMDTAGFSPSQISGKRGGPGCTEAPVVYAVLPKSRKQLCLYTALGRCRYGESCVNLHGDACDVCGLQVLHPTDTAQRRRHLKSCLQSLERDMELSFAVQRSQDLACGICKEVVYQKARPSERRFGLLPNCKHTFCLQCVRQWRRTKQLDSSAVKSCPECRVLSHFVIPSEYWVEEEEEKQALIRRYKEAMSQKACRYFDEGRGSCLFAENCFYKHAYPDGHTGEPQSQEVGASSGSGELTQQGEHSSPSEEREEEEGAASGLGKAAAGADDDDGV